MDKLLFKRIIFSALTLLMVIYVVYLLISANFDSYPTENVVQATVTDKIYTNGLIVRDEHLINTDISGVVSYSVSEGESVKAGGEVAKIYSDEDDAVAEYSALLLEEQKKSLEELQKNKSLNAVGIDTVDNSINNSIIEYLSDINNGVFHNIYSDMNSTAYYINQRQLLIGKSKNFNTKIASLQSEIDSLKASAGDSIGTLTTDVAGHFSAYCDGYENAVSFKDIEKLTIEDLRKIKPSKTDGACVGKIVKSVNWYVACEVTDDEATELSLWDGNVSINFSDAVTELVPAKIHRIKKSSDGSNAIVILECDYMDSGLIEARQEPIEIGLGTYTGLRVSKRAIHDDIVTRTIYDENNTAHKEEKKVQGVYILYGSEVQFKQISILYADDDYVICDPNPPEEVLFNGDTVSLYDKIIVEGDGLYDGKIIG